MTYRFLAPARVEFDAAVDWYDARRTGLGDDFADEVYATVQRIVANPLAYSRVPRATRGREIRNLKVSRFDYLVVYEVLPSEVLILSIRHARRRVRAWRRRS
ncbi:MAG TPA: type II toxin-antitoxin system RelE/ParE family toxin [Fimbriiglobus sp.]|nr:type II toxin-antitoxin system RelE/ParE family toxin [Fimbriiglobus sp.]